MGDALSVVDRPLSGSPAGLFALVRTTLIDVMGATSLAVLIRRAANTAIVVCPDLRGFIVVRKGLGYAYQLPADWQRTDSSAAYGALAALIRTLLPLVTDLCGLVVTRRVVNLGPLHDHLVLGNEDTNLWENRE